LNKNSNYEQELNDIIKNNSGALERYKNVFNSKYSIQFLFDLKSGDYKKIRDNLNLQQKLSLMIQILFALNFMHNNDFYHRDVHWKNLCYIETEEEFIDILNYKIPTHGYIWSIIDYGNVISNKYKLTRDEKKILTFRNLRYEDNMNLLHTIFDGKMLDVINKIVYYIKLTSDEMKLFDDFFLDYQDTYNYCLHASDELYLINMIYNKLI
jgi:hypothetical protein